MKQLNVINKKEVIKLKERIRENLKKGFGSLFFKPYVFLSLLMFACFLIDSLLGGMLNSLGGVRPRDLGQLQGILLNVYFHSSWIHFMSNIGPFLLIGFFLRRVISEKEFWVMWFSLSLMTGSFTWLFGSPNSLHIGVSGIIFGMWSLVMTLAIKERSFKSVLIGVIVGLMYGLTFIYGLVPKAGISFAGHFYGLISGILFGLVFINYRKSKTDFNRKK